MPDRQPIAVEDLSAMEMQLVDTLARTKHLAANAVSSSNTSYFLLRADQCFLLAALQWRLGRPTLQIARALKEFLDHALTAFELGATRPAIFSHALWSVAMTLGDIRTAHFIAASPEEVRGLPAPPQAHRIVAETRIGFALLRGNDAFLARLLEVFEGLCFDTDPAELTTHELQKARRVYPVLRALADRNSSAFNGGMRAILSAHPSEGRRLTSDFNDRIAALALLRLAELRGIAVDLGPSPPDLPTALLTENRA